LHQPLCGEAAEFQVQLRLYLDVTYNKKDKSAAQVIRTTSCGFVYDLCKYFCSNLWGPFIHNSAGQVSWVHMEHIYGVLANIAYEISLLILFRGQKEDTADQSWPELI